MFLLGLCSRHSTDNSLFLEINKRTRPSLYSILSLRVGTGLNRQSFHQGFPTDMLSHMLTWVIPKRSSFVLLFKDAFSYSSPAMTSPGEIVPVNGVPIESDQIPPAPDEIGLPDEVQTLAAISPNLLRHTADAVLPLFMVGDHSLRMPAK